MFNRDGYLTIKNLASPEHLLRIKKYLDPNNRHEKSPGNFGNSGGFIQLDPSNSDIKELLMLNTTIKALEFLGGHDIKLHSFYASIKQPNSVELPWHSDLFYPYDKEETPEVFVIYYLDDTDQTNGCLRVIPGSHLWPREVQEKNEGDGDRNNEIPLPINIGDVFIGDRRLLHATYANSTNNPRSCITIAYALNFDKLDQKAKHLIRKNKCLKMIHENKEVSESMKDLI